jgi:hypothetical protein
VTQISYAKHGTSSRIFWMTSGSAMQPTSNSHMLKKVHFFNYCLRYCNAAFVPRLLFSKQMFYNIRFLIITLCTNCNLFNQFHNQF